ncbi:hypothetical protein HPB49_025191 [Dermacentor silvarum]|uniref:Uncharacterized protein n=1 Tax=Dermacentor silvarum TaxID=543639 RepID=A0ACB8C667_DERSI|nr:hypothetical protein HPB49_025191 [Dermacentor silvarum]
MAGATNDNAHEMEIENNSQDSTADQSNMEFDENSGKTLSQAGPWFQAIKARKNKKSPNEDRIQEGGKQGNSQNQQRGLNARSNPRVESSMQANSNQQRQQDQGSRTSGKPPPRRATPPLPDNDYKVVYRPRTGMKLSSWPDEKITEGLARASGSPFKEFCAKVTIQTQWKQNLIIASTADEDYALKLGSINGIELGAATYEMTPYIKPLPGTVRGVVHGITACTTEKRLAELLAANNCGILHARMLGKSTSAVITFEGPHVPFYVKVASSYTRCRPYRRSVQYCKACGEIGHRQDVCPNPDKPICNRCGVQNPQADHDCQLQCKLCGLPHETASKECEKRLKPRPPPLYVRERSKSRGRQPSITRETSSSSSVYGTNKPQQDQQKISWAEVIASSKSTTDPFPSLPTQERNSRYEETISSLRRQNADLMTRNEGLMKRLEEQERRQEERDRRAQAREQALEVKLQHLIEQLQKQQEPTTTLTPPREHTPPIEDLESGIEHKMNKARIEDKAELRNEFRVELAQAVDTISKSVAATVQAAVQTLRQEITQMGNELSQRISILEKDKEQARKKPKYPIREAQMNETLGSQDGE